MLVDSANLLNDYDPATAPLLRQGVKSYDPKLSTFDRSSIVSPIIYSSRIVLLARSRH